MRETKFRAWHKKDKEMWDWKYLLKTMVGGTRQNAFSRDDLELMQFTGLRDKNGKEIYEGDILAMPYGGHPARWTVGELSEYGLYFQRHTIKPYQSPYPYRDLRHFDKAEVIGNIYENPELLINN